MSYSADLAPDKANQEYLCFPCLETVERYIESNDTYTMEWREAGEDEYETVA